MTVTNGELVTQVRQALDAAREAGQPTRGRPTLVRLTGATDHAVRKVLAELAAENTSEGSADSDRRVAVGELAASHLASPGEVGSPAADRVTSAGDHGPTPFPSGGRLVAWAGFVFGSVMSIAANVLHVWLPAAHEPPGWSPGIARRPGLRCGQLD
ncbi:hypothetical protein LWC34_37930 [Kibdelosporangium philippinense]|uniref:Uncharacterized protein n=1 Tax=Kibdelosporangium philippinense TaxID=211113 RepID=A0ABS8ZLV6_9PSEU|nr:hypothetical protein [Kibdelosporangium philippinense]MCE7008552.1 hypothetical protein [Kibdelosporangium philippinense]